MGPAVEGKPNLVMYTDSDLSTDMALCGLLSYGVLKAGCSVASGARYGSAGTFLVKPPVGGASPHPQSHYEQPNMMKIVLRHYVRVRLLPMLQERGSHGNHQGRQKFAGRFRHGASSQCFDLLSQEGYQAEQALLCRRHLVHGRLCREQLYGN